MDILVSQVHLNGTCVIASTRQVKARGMVDDVRIYGDSIPAAFPAFATRQWTVRLVIGPSHSEVNTYGVA
jgi:hypothetical protein